jgi:hypothetical protein
MKRLLPPSRTAPITDATYFERVMRVHLNIIDEAPGTRSKSSVAWQAVGYATVIFLLLAVFGIFGDLA